MGYYKEKKQYEKDKNKQVVNQTSAVISNVLGMPQVDYCGWCGSSIQGKEKNRCQGDHLVWVKGTICKDCAKKCGKCGKYFCPKHINNHKCV